MKCQPKWCVIIRLHVSKVHLEKIKSKWGKEITSAACLKSSPSVAKCLFNHRRWEGATFWHYGRLETKQTHVTHRRHTLYQNVLYLQGNSVQHFLFTVRMMKRFLRERKNRWREGQMWACLSVSISPAHASQTLLGITQTSGRNCQWDWYSTWSNKKWISLPWYKHKWPEPWCICLDPLWSPPPCFCTVPTPPTVAPESEHNSTQSCGLCGCSLSLKAFMPEVLTSFTCLKMFKYENVKKQKLHYYLLIKM